MSSDSAPVSPNSGPNNSFFQPIFISFLTLTSLFIALYIIRWFLQRTTTRNAALLLDKRNAGGLDSAAIAALPSFPYRTNGSSMECPICLSAVEEEESVKLLPECMHSFHSECVDVWLSGHSTCPVCRIEVRGLTGRVETVTVPEPVVELER